MTVSHAKFIFPIKRFSGQSQAVPVCVALVVSLCQPFLPNVSPWAGTGLLLMRFAQLLVFGLFFFFFYCDLFLRLFFPFYPWGNTQGPRAFQGVSTQPLKFRTLFFFSTLSIINEQILVGKILRATKHVGTALASVNSVKYTAQICVKEIMVITRHTQFAVSGQGSPQQQHCPRQALGTISGFYNQH